MLEERLHRIKKDFVKLSLLNLLLFDINAKYSNKKKESGSKKYCEKKTLKNPDSSSTTSYDSKGEERIEEDNKEDDKKDIEEDNKKILEIKQKITSIGKLVVQYREYLTDEKNLNAKLQILNPKSINLKIDNENFETELNNLNSEYENFKNEFLKSLNDKFKNLTDELNIEIGKYNNQNILGVGFVNIESKSFTIIKIEENEIKNVLDSYNDYKRGFDTKKKDFINLLKQKLIAEVNAHNSKYPDKIINLPEGFNDIHDIDNFKSEYNAIDVKRSEILGNLMKLFEKKINKLEGLSNSVYLTEKKGDINNKITEYKKITKPTNDNIKEIDEYIKSLENIDRENKQKEVQKNTDLFNKLKELKNVLKGEEISELKDNVVPSTDKLKEIKNTINTQLQETIKDKNKKIDEYVEKCNIFLSEKKISADSYKIKEGVNINVDNSRLIDNLKDIDKEIEVLKKLFLQKVNELTEVKGKYEEMCNILNCINYGQKEIKLENTGKFNDIKGIDDIEFSVLESLVKEIKEKDNLKTKIKEINEVSALLGNGYYIYEDKNSLKIDCSDKNYKDKKLKKDDKNKIFVDLGKEQKQYFFDTQNNKIKDELENEIKKYIEDFNGYILKKGSRIEIADVSKFCKDGGFIKIINDKFDNILNGLLDSKSKKFDNKYHDGGEGPNVIYKIRDGFFILYYNILKTEKNEYNRAIYLVTNNKIKFLGNYFNAVKSTPIILRYTKDKYIKTKIKYDDFIDCAIAVKDIKGGYYIKVKLYDENGKENSEYKIINKMDDSSYIYDLFTEKILLVKDHKIEKTCYDINLEKVIFYKRTKKI